MQIVDRRLNPKSKSLGNRQRFLRRAKGEIRDAVKDALKKRKVSEAEGGERVTIRSKSLREPSFNHGRGTGQRDFVLPGNEEYQVGDAIPKPQGGGGGGRGNQGSARRRGPGRVHLLADPRGIPRHLLRGPEAAEPRQGEAQGPEVAEARARRLHHLRLAVAAQSRAHAAQQSRPPLRAAPPDAKPRSTSSLRISPRPRLQTPRDDTLDRRVHQHSSSARSACARRSPSSIRSICATTASTGCRARPRRPSCSV